VDGLREALADPDARAQLVPLLADLVPSAVAPAEDGWLDTKGAAAYLGISATALHKVTAARTIRFEQDCPGGKCWFKRADLDEWRRRS
jgi:excisionase family DNA binding protein